MAGAAVGATALFAPSAQAANFEVNTLADGPADACEPAPGDCKLRDAVTEANGNGLEDTITFGGLTGTIVLTEGQIPLSGEGLTLDGPGAATLAISGDADSSGTPTAGDSRIFAVSGGDEKTIEGLTLTRGFGSSDGADTGPGGAITASGETTLRLVDSVVSGSQVGADGTGGRGGGIYSSGVLDLERTEVSGNRATAGGGIATSTATSPRPANTITDSEISDNTATTGRGGGIDGGNPLEIAGSTITGNDSAAAGGGGGIAQAGKYSPLDVADSVISGNTGGDAGGGGILLSVQSDKYNSNNVISGTTISGNTSTGDGAGLNVIDLDEGDELSISRSTLSGNASEGFGGGFTLPAYLGGDLDVVNSTVSGNTAAVGGGGALGTDDTGSPFLYGGGSVDVDNSTIASNTATSRGGGLYLSQYDEGEGVMSSETIPLTSTIVADNTAAGTANDLDRADGSSSGGFDLAFTLVERAGDAPLVASAGENNITGLDPQLGALANNGGPTATQLPAQSSPVVDKGDAPPRLTTDQRGAPRTIDAQPPNPPNGDGTDMGAVETVRPADAAGGGGAGGAGAGGTNTATTNVITRVAPLRVTQRLTPSRDRRAPFRFRMTGRVVPPASLRLAQACGTSVGIVSVQVKYGRTTISTRRVALRPDCTYSSTVVFRNRSRFRRARTLKFTVRFHGNTYLEPVINSSLRARVR